MRGKSHFVSDQGDNSHLTCCLFGLHLVSVLVMLFKPITRGAQAVLFPWSLQMHISVNVTVLLFKTSLPHRDGMSGKILHVILLLTNANCTTPRSMLALYDYDDLGIGDME
jgi:hypothetical protein